MIISIRLSNASSPSSNVLYCAKIMSFHIMVNGDKMKMNHDCIRDVLIYLRDNTTIVQDSFIRNKFTYIAVTQSQVLNNEVLAKNYSQNEIAYSMLILRNEALIETSDMIQVNQQVELPRFQVNDITVAGHEFIEAIENKTIWKVAKNRAIKIGGASLKAIIATAKFLLPLALEHPDTFQKLPEFINFL